MLRRVKIELFQKRYCAFFCFLAYIDGVYFAEELFVLHRVYQEKGEKIIERYKIHCSKR